MISEMVDGVSVLFSGGSDGTIKFWNTELDDQKENHYITTMFGHKGTVLAMAFSKNRSILVSSSSDMTIKVWRMKDNFDKIINPLFQCIATFKDFNAKKKREEEKPFWINTLSMKETDIIELYAGDTTGRVHFYHYIDQAYMKIKEAEKKSFMSKIDDKKIVLDNFNYVKTVTPHSRTVIKVIHSIFDSMIYSIGFDNLLIGYNIKTDNSIFFI
jgi:WD40 repeat protein